VFAKSQNAAHEKKVFPRFGEMERTWCFITSS